MERKRWLTVLGAVVIGIVFLCFLVGCGGGSGGSSSSGSVPTDPVPPDPVTLCTPYSVSDGDIAIFAKVSGSTITSYVSNFAFAFDDVYTGTSTIQADRSFSIDYHPYPTGGPTVFSATGVVDASGNVIHWTATNFIFVLDETLELPVNSYPGLYYGNNTINGGSGVFVGTIDWWGNLHFYYGNPTNGYTRSTEQLQLYTTNSFSTSEGDITLNGSVNATGITGTWNNSVTKTSGAFSAPNISCGGGEVVTPPSSYTLTVNAANGTVVKNPNQASYASGTSVQLTATANSGYTFTGWSGDITGTANPVTVTMNSNKAITANFTSATTVSAPTLTPASGTYTSAQNVTLSTTTSGATIRYTADGSVPTETVGTVYSGPISVSSSSTIRAVAYLSGWTTSSVSSGTYTITTSTASIISVSAGSSHTVALKSDGTVWRWGSGTLTPVQVSGLTGVIAVSAGGDHTVALKSDGTVWAWGSNSFGELGDGTTTNRSTPVQVSGLTGIVAVSSGSSYTVAVKSDGTVWAWGYNGYGALGDGTTTNRLTPVLVSGLTSVVAFSASSFNTTALRSDGTVWAWGRNNMGQIGDGTTTNRLTPVQVSGLTGATTVSSGNSTSFVVRSDGTVWASGLNDFGQLGNGSNLNSNVLVQVSGLTGVIAVSANESHTAAIRSDGTVWGWGLNSGGALGDGTTTNRSTPVQVMKDGLPFK